MKAAVTILLVEDDKSMLEGMSDLLQMSDIDYEVQVLTAGNGREALSIMGQQTPPPDLIVSDIMMPEMDGLQFLEAVHQKPEWLDIPFIFLTAKGEKQEIHKGRKSGADLYITKPFQSLELLNLIKSQLDKSFHRQIINQQNINGLKKDILQILNHEFRTPLTYVTAYYEMLVDSLNHFADYENFQDYLHGIQAGCIRLTRLVEDFIQVIELRTGAAQKLHQQQATVISNFGELIGEAIQTAQKQAQQRGVQLHYEAVRDLPPILGNWSNLVNVLSRLLDNAIKFTSHTPKKPTGNVYISTHVVNQELHISIEDDGTGFPKYLQNKIFELFFQYNRGFLEQQGAGIGLTIAKGWADLHNGRIEIESQEGVGSIFTLVLPVYLDKAIIDPDKRFLFQEIAHILIVEDDQHLMEGLQELLEIYEGKYRLKILTAQNGAEGLEVLSRHPIDLIISDIMMPQMDGLEFLEKVRENTNFIQIPFIFLTAKSDKRDMYHGFERGAEEFIPKPYDSDELMELVAKQLDRRFRRQDVMMRNFEELKQGILRFITPDFRLPISKVNEYSVKLAHSLENQTHEELMDSLREIQMGSSRLSRLIEDFIALAELKTGEAAINYALRSEPIYDIGVVLYEISQPYTTKGAHVVCPLNVHLPPIYGNIRMLSSAINRLIDVGLEYITAKDGMEKTLSLYATQADGDVLLTILCQGILPPPLVQDILDIFAGPEIVDFQTHTLPTLSIIKGYIHLHNGRITLTHHTEANPTFTIMIPVYTLAS